jgi:acetylornithine deacetylase
MSLDGIAISLPHAAVQQKAVAKRRGLICSRAVYSITDASMAQTADRADAIAFLRSLIAAQPQGEGAVQALVAERLAAAGCTVEEVRYDPAAVKLVGEFASETARSDGERVSVVGCRPGEVERRSLILFAHPDGESVDPTGWTRDPFRGEETRGRLYGWGVADDLAGVAAGVLAVERAAASGVPLGEVIMASTPSKRHARGVSAVLQHGYDADAAVYLHPAESGEGMREVKAFASGQIEFRVTVAGRLPQTTEPGHTAFAHLAVNPVDKLFLLYRALLELDIDRGSRVSHPRLDAAVGRSTNLMVSALACGGAGRFARIQPSASFGAALSFPPTEALEAVQAEVAAVLAEAAASDPWLADNPPQVEWRSGTTGCALEEDHPLWQSTAAAVRAVTGEAPFVNALHTGSDIRNPWVQKGIPTVGLGCLCGDLTHSGRADEWVDVADFHRMVEAVAAIVTDWCGQPRAG